jgi:cell wall-associated NlpC family hydrolase
MASAPNRYKVLQASAQLSVVLGVILSFCFLHPQPAHSAPDYTAYSVGNSGKSIVRQARYYVRKEKRYDPVTWSCSDFTRASVGYGVGVWMPDWDDAQLNYGRPTAGLKDPLKRGDLVFFREHGGVGKVSHVAIYAGRGYVLHSSAYWGYSTKTYMPYITNNKGKPAFKPGYTRRIR